MNFNKGKEIISLPGTVTIDFEGERGLTTVFLIAIAFVIMVQTWFLPIADSASSPMPEKFIYNLTWTGIKAGTASLELRNDGEKVKILSTAQSASWGSVFYTVHDRLPKIHPSSLPRGEPLGWLPRRNERTIRSRK